tara:strand:- start:307616 stop:309442 length:1827 start_codon:yes stop_codon:yes gene_type:complete
MASVVFLVLGFFGKVKFSKKKAMTRLVVCASVTAILALTSWGDLSRLTTLAFKPRSLFDYPIPQITATITAPLYLKKETFQKNMGDITSDSAGLNPIHEGSILDVHVVGTDWAPVIKLSDGKQVAFEKQDDGSFKASTKIDKQISWSLNQGSHTLGAWPIILLDDEEPQIARFNLEDLKNEKGYLAFSVDVSDDRKIMAAAIELRNSDGMTRDRKNLAVRGVKSYDSVFYIDFTGSDYAGAVADVKLSLEDEAGQVSSIVLDNIRIPIKTYRHEVAGKLISLYNGLGERNPELRSITRQIKALGLLPDSEGLPPVYYMAMRSAYWRLVNPNDEADRQIARDLLWDTAQKIENSDMGTIENNIIAALDELALLIHKKKSVHDVREGIRDVDSLFRDYIGAGKTTSSRDYTLDVDILALRKLYSYILAFSDQEKYHNAALMVDVMRKGLVQNDGLILSKDGLGNYFALSEGRQIIDNLISIQKTLLASSYNEQMQGKLLKNMKPSDKRPDTVSNKHSQFILQSKVGDAVKLLGQKVSFASDNSGFLLKNATVLVDEILVKMKNSEANQVAQSQSELIAIMSNLKRELNKPISKAPELQNIMKEINSKPVL